MQSRPWPALMRISCSLLLVAIAAAGCATSAKKPPAAPAEAPGGGPAPHLVDPEFVPVIRYGRYTLVELVPSAAQRDLLRQVVDVSLPSSQDAKVGDALRHVLLRSGYQLCTSREVNALRALPLPASHYRLGPVSLRDALLMLAGSGWEMQVDDRARRICFTQSTAPTLATASKTPGHTGSAAVEIGKVERHPLPEAAQP